MLNNQIQIILGEPKGMMSVDNSDIGRMFFEVCDSEDNYIGFITGSSLEEQLKLNGYELVRINKES